MKWLLAVLLLSGLALGQQHGDTQYGDQFPDASEPIKEVNGHWVHDKAGDPPRWYQHTFTKKFVLANGVFLGSNVFDIETTQHCQAKGTCVEAGGYESRGEMYRNDMIADGALIGLSLLIQSRHFPKKAGWLAYIAPTYGTAVHLKGGIEGLKYY